MARLVPVVFSLERADMLDDHKHDSKPIPVRLTDRLMVDAMAECVRLDKKPAELIRYALRVYLYGTVGITHAGNNENSSDE
jgi:hypothetical protein